MRSRTDPAQPVTAILIDDEPLALDGLRLALRAHPEVEVVGEAGDGREALRLARALTPDLLFLDIQMPDMDGFAVLRELGRDVPEVVFVTAYDEHAVRAFEVHALDYLLKPFDDARLAACVGRALEQVRRRRQGEARRSLDALLRQAIGPGAGGSADAGFAERIMVRDTARIYFVDAEDVDWFQSAGNYVRLHTGEAQHLIRSTLADLQSRLDPRRFVRIHRSTIVNVSRIAEVKPWVGGDYIAILRDGRRLKVSRTYRDDLLRPLA